MEFRDIWDGFFHLHLQRLLHLLHYEPYARFTILILSDFLDKPEDARDVLTT